VLCADCRRAGLKQLLVLCLAPGADNASARPVPDPSANKKSHMVTWWLHKGEVSWIDILSLINKHRHYEVLETSNNRLCAME